MGKQNNQKTTDHKSNSTPSDLEDKNDLIRDYSKRMDVIIIEDDGEID